MKNVSLATISRTLKQLGITNKKVADLSLVASQTHFRYQLTKEASERSPVIRAGYGMQIGSFYNPEQLVFLDECYVDKRNTARLRGWTPAGDRAIVKQPFIRGKR